MGCSLNPDLFLEYAFNFAHYFQYAHIFLTIMSVQSKFSDRKSQKTFLKSAPLGTFLITLISCSAGGVLTGILTQKKPPILAMFSVLTDPGHTIMFLSSYYMIFYQDFQVSASTVNLLYIPKEILRCVKIVKGVKMGLDVTSGMDVVLGVGGFVNWYALSISVFLGTLQSCGTGFLINMVFSLVGFENEPLKTGKVTKVSIVFAGLYYLPGLNNGLVAIIQTSYCLYYKFSGNPDCYISGLFEVAGKQVFREDEIVTKNEKDEKNTKDEKSKDEKSKSE